jgi:hypothetical protein
LAVLIREVYQNNSIISLDELMDVPHSGHQIGGSEEQER